MQSPLLLFKKLVQESRLPHALLLCGSYLETKEGVDTLIGTLLEQAGADQYLKWKKGSHPDIHILKPEGRSGLHSMHSLRTLQEQCALVPLEGPLKCFVIEEAERMLPTSSNALLKTFEEPQAKTLIILTTQFPQRLLPTIRSRCQSYNFSNAKEVEEPLFDLLIPLLRGQKEREVIQEMEKELELERADFVKEKMSALSKELTGVQKEALSKEIEGEAALHYQRRAFSLLEGCLKIYRDLYAHHLGLDKKLFFYPDLIEQTLSIEPKPLVSVEQCVKEAKVAIQRGIKFSVALQHLNYAL